MSIEKLTTWKVRQGAGVNMGKHLCRVPIKKRFAYIAVEIDRIRESLRK